VPKSPIHRCDHGGCIVSAIVAYEFTENGVRQKTLVDGKELSMGRARLVRGSDEERIALVLDLWPRKLALMRWRYSDAKADLRTVPWPENENLSTFFLSRSGDLLEIRGRQTLMEVWRHSPEGDKQLASLRALQSVDTGIYGLGERSDGSIWLHWGDHLGLLSPGQPPRSYNLEPLLPRRFTWAGAARRRPCGSGSMAACATSCAWTSPTQRGALESGGGDLRQQPCGRGLDAPTGERCVVASTPVSALS
jgi:hypothetical protein